MGNTTARKNVNSYLDGANWSENQVLNRYSGWIVTILDGAVYQIPLHVRRALNDDLKQEASLALLLCWRRYQKERIECPFLNYAWKRVHGAVIDYYRDKRYITKAGFKTFSLDAPLYMGRYNEGRTRVDFVDSRGEYRPEFIDPPSQRAEDLGTKIDLYNALKALDTWQQNFLNLLYVKGDTLEFIGELGGVTESRACQIHTHILKEIRKGMDVVI